MFGVITCICNNCGKEYEMLKASRNGVNSPGQYCSRKCEEEAREKRQEKEEKKISKRTSLSSIVAIIYLLYQYPVKDVVQMCHSGSRTCLLC